ncbi:MAG: hypothetical protein HZB55_01710 [Deltaproteobacteria bacterium]|nr:hypothetical protein [Deltaproteobacteria bacterium]
MRDRSVPTAYLLAGGLLASVAFLVALHRIADFDYWTHLALGRAMWAAGTIRVGEPFLAGAQGGAGVPDSWPFQLLAFALRQGTGDVGMCLLVALCSAATFALLWTLVPRSAHRGALGLAWALLALVAFNARVRFLPRPEILGYVFTAAGLALSHRWGARPSLARLAAIGALLALWSRVHLSWAPGAALVLAPVALAPRLDFWRAQWGQAHRRPLIVGLAVLAAAGGWRAASVVLSILQAKRADGGLSLVTEMQPVWTFPELLVPFGAAALLCLALSWSVPEGRGRRLALWALAVALGSVAARNVGLGLLGLAPPAMEGIVRSTWHERLLVRRAVPALAGVAAVVLVAAAVQDRDPPWGVGVRWELVPRDAARFVKDASLPAPLLNSFDIGGYLDWAWGGAPPTFIDGRVFGANPTFADLDALENAQGAEGILERRGIRTIVLRALFYDSGRLLPLVEWLLSRPDWSLVRANDALVFVRAPLPERLEPLHPREAWRYVLWEADVKAFEGGGSALPGL